METFYPTVGIVAGILFPIMIVIGAAMILIAMYAAIVSYQLKLDKQRKTPPFDSVDTGMNYKDKSLHVRFIKNGKAIWISILTDKELKG